MKREGGVRAFSAEHVGRITGLSQRQLGYWDRTGFFSPHYAFKNRKSAFSRIYSFMDVASLRALSVLRKDYQIPLQKLRKVAKKLSRYEESWSELVLYISGKEVHFREPERDNTDGALTDQYVSIPLSAIIEDVTEKSNRLKQRAANQFGRVERHRYIISNAWAIAGTRIPAAAIRRFSEAGYSPKQIIREYPTITERDIYAAVRSEKKNELAKTA